MSEAPNPPRETSQGEVDKIFTKQFQRPERRRNLLRTAIRFGAPLALTAALGATGLTLAHQGNQEVTHRPPTPERVLPQAPSTTREEVQIADAVSVTKPSQPENIVDPAQAERTRQANEAISTWAATMVPRFEEFQQELAKDPDTIYSIRRSDPDPNDPDATRTTYMLYPAVQESTNDGAFDYKSMESTVGNDPAGNPDPNQVEDVILTTAVNKTGGFGATGDVAFSELVHVHRGEKGNWSILDQRKPFGGAGFFDSGSVNTDQTTALGGALERYSALAADIQTGAPVEPPPPTG